MKHDIKRAAALLLVFAVAAATLAGCGGGNSTSAPQSEAASVAAPSTAETQSTPATVPDSTPATPDSAVASDGGELGTHALEEILSTVQEAAGIGATIPVEELDLRAGGVDTDNIVRFVGVESQTASQDGGIVVVMVTEPGAMDAVAEDMIEFRDSRMDDRYAEFATAMEHTGEARTVYNNDVVIYAVSATGDYQALDATLTDLFDTVINKLPVG